MLSFARSRPSMLILISGCSAQYSFHSQQVNWRPWSELIISGAPYSAMAFLSTSKQFDASNVLCGLQPITNRLYTSMMAVRHMNPFAIEIYVKSLLQTRFLWSIFRPLSKYGMIYTLISSEIYYSKVQVWIFMSCLWVTLISFTISFSSWFSRGRSSSRLTRMLIIDISCDFSIETYGFPKLHTYLPLRTN